MMVLVEVGKVSGALCAIILLAGSIFRVGLGVYRLAKRIENIDKAADELRPNGGESLVDRVGKVLQRLDDHDEQFAEGSRRFGRIEKRLGIEQH